MPAYSPDFNPAGYVFGKIRTFMKYSLGNLTNININQCIQSFYASLDYISLSDMTVVFKASGYLMNKTDQ